MSGRWDKIEKGDVWDAPEKKPDKKYASGNKEKQEPSQLILPNIGMQNSGGVNNIQPSGNTSWLSQFSFGQILMLLSVVPIVIILVCISMACIQFFLSPPGKIVAVAATGVAFIWIMKRGGSIL